MLSIKRNENRCGKSQRFIVNSKLPQQRYLKKKSSKLKKKNLYLNQVF